MNKARQTDWFITTASQKNLIKYQSLNRQFENKYDQEFEAFRQTILHSEPAFEVEQDYFDWERAITGAEDMEREISVSN